MKLIILICSLVLCSSLSLGSSCSDHYSKVAAIKNSHPYKRFQGTWNFESQGKRYKLEIVPTSEVQNGGAPYFINDKEDRARVYLNGVELPVRVGDNNLTALNGGVDGIEQIKINLSNRTSHLDLEIVSLGRPGRKISNVTEAAIASGHSQSFDKAMKALKTEELLSVRAKQLGVTLTKKHAGNGFLYASYMDPAQSKYEDGYLVVRLNTIGRAETLREAERLDLPQTYYGYPVLLQDLTLSKTFER